MMGVAMSTFDDDADGMIVELIRAAVLGQEEWMTVALHERAAWGIVHPWTWDKLTLGEQNKIGRVDQTTARRLLSAGPP